MSTGGQSRSVVPAPVSGLPVSGLPAGVMGQTLCCLAVGTPEPLGAERLIQAPPKPKAK